MWDTASGLVIPAEWQHKARIVRNGVLPVAAEQHTVPATQRVLSPPGRGTAGTERHPEIRLPVPCSQGQADKRDTEVPGH